MKLIITTNDCLTSKGFTSVKEGPVAKAFRFTNSWAEDVSVENNRLSAKKEGFPVRFAIKGFTVRDYRDLMHGSRQSCICELVPLPIPVTSIPQP